MSRFVALRRLAAGLALLGLRAAAGGGAFADTQRTPLVVAISPVTYSEIPIRYALRTGMFAQAGLDVRLQILANGAAITAGVIGGSLDVGLGTVSGVISAVAHGLPVKLVAPAVTYDAGAPSILLLVLKQSPLSSARDLLGKTIALSNLNDALRPATIEWLARSGVGVDAANGVKFLELPQSAMLAALEAGRVDAIAVISPTLDAALASGNVRVLAPVLDVVARKLLWTAYFARSDWAGAHENTMQTFLHVLAQAAAYTNEHHAAMVPELAGLLDEPPAVVERMIWPVSDAALDPAKIQPMIDLLARSHTIAQPFPARELIFQP